MKTNKIKLTLISVGLIVALSIMTVVIVGSIGIHKELNEISQKITKITERVDNILEKIK